MEQARCRWLLPITRSYCLSLYLQRRQTTSKLVVSRSSWMPLPDMSTTTNYSFEKYVYAQTDRRQRDRLTDRHKIHLPKKENWHKESKVKWITALKTGIYADTILLPHLRCRQVRMTLPEVTPHDGVWLLTLTWLHMIPWHDSMADSTIFVNSVHYLESAWAVNSCDPWRHAMSHQSLLTHLCSSQHNCDCCSFNNVINKPVW